MVPATWISDTKLTCTTPTCATDTTVNFDVLLQSQAIYNIHSVEFKCLGILEYISLSIEYYSLQDCVPIVHATMESVPLEIVFVMLDGQDHLAINNL